MLLKILNSRYSILLIFVPVIIALLLLPTITSPVSLTMDQAQMPLYEVLLILTAKSSLILNIIACLLFILIAFGMVRLNEQYIFIRQRTDLPAFVFAFIASGSVVLVGMHPSLLASSLLFLAIDRIFQIYQGKATLARSFDAGFLIGIATLFYLFAGVYILWFWFALGILGYLRGREILAGLMGFCAPLLLAFAWYFWTENLVEIQDTIKQLVDNKNEFGEVSLHQYTYWAILGFLVVIASFYMLMVYEEKKISSRKYFIVLLSLFAVSVLSFLFLPGSGIEQYYISIIPVTYITSHYFVLQRHRWIGEVLFSILVLASLLIHFLG